MPAHPPSRKRKHSRIELCPTPNPEPRRRRQSICGNLRIAPPDCLASRKFIGIIFPVSVEAQHDFAYAFLSILFEGAPFILLGTLISGFIDIYLPANTMERLLPKRTFYAVLVAGLLGFILPVCECAVVPVIRRLVKKGLPLSSALTYMLAAPIVNPITAFSTWKAFKGPDISVGNLFTASPDTLMTVSRLGLGFLIAVAAGLIIAKIPLSKILRPRLLKSLKPKKSPAHDHHHHGHDHHHHDHDHPSGSRLVAALRSAVRDFIDVGIYFTLGVAITALFNTGIAPGAAWLDSLAENPWQAPAALMVLGFILSLCSTSDAFIAASLDRFAWGAKLAFLTFGPMMDVKLIFLYQTVFKRRFILFLGLGLFITTWLACVAWQSTLSIP